MKKLLIIFLALLIALFFMACPDDPASGDGGDAGDAGDAGSTDGGDAGDAGSTDGGDAGDAGSTDGGDAGDAGSTDGGDAGDGGTTGTPGESVIYDFEDMTVDQAPDSPWVVDSSSTGAGNGPMVRENANTHHNALMISETSLGTGYPDWGTSYTGYSYAQLPIVGGDFGGTLTFNYYHLGWDSNAEATTPNYGAFEFWIDAPSDLSNPGTPDWSETEQVLAGGEGEDFAGSAVITIPAGNHTLTWRKAKTDTSFDEDSAWIDNVAFTASVGGGDDDPGNGKWLMMMYIDGDCNLEGALWGDVNEMEYGLNQMDTATRDNVKIVVLWDGSPDHSSSGPDDSKLYELGTDTTEDTTLSSNTQDLTSTGWFTTEVNMGDGNTIIEFLNWANTNYTGYDNKLLVLSDHGGGARGIGGNGQGGTRAICWDDSDSHDFLETKELANAIESSDIGKLSILGMDACLMATVEEAYELKDTADYFVASLETEQGDGWEFNHWLPQMTASTGPRTLSTIIVESYKANFESSYDDQTLSATDLLLMGELKTAVDNLASAIVGSADSSSIKTVFESSQSFDGTYATQIELGSFCENLVSNNYVTTEANAVLTALGNTVVYSWADTASGEYHGAGVTTKKGLALVGEITSTDFYNTSYLDFATSPGWKDVLNSWY